MHLFDVSIQPGSWAFNLWKY